MFRLICQLIGAGLVAHIFYRLYAFINLYFIQETGLPKYLHAGDNSYALITGASDGIGLDVARALKKRGFNIILHSRNPEKLARVASGLKAATPGRDTVWVAADAMDPASAIPKIAAKVDEIKAKGGKLTVLVNNVGGQAVFRIPVYTALNDMPVDAMNKSFNLNAIFPIALTKALLPELVANTPSLILNEGSYAGVYAGPLLTTYASSKALIHMFTKCLSLEHNLLNTPVDVQGILIGEVLTDGSGGGKLSFAKISSEEMAESIIARIGCGKSLVCGSWKHCVGAEMLKWFPTSMQETAMTGQIKRLWGIETAKVKTQ